MIKYITKNNPKIIVVSGSGKAVTKRFLPQFTTPNEPLIFQLIVLGSICVALNTFVDVLAVLGAHRLLKVSAKRAQRERVIVKTSGITMLGLGTYLALAERN